MALVPALDLRGGDPREDEAPPNAVEAEQGLLGALLFDNEAIARLSGILQPSHFYEPFHGRLFAAIMLQARKGLAIEAIFLAEQFRRDAAFKELGGLRYLADLVDRAPPSSIVDSYEAAILEVATRRELIRIGGDLATAATSLHVGEGGEHVDAAGLMDEFSRRLIVAQLSGVRDELTPIGESIAGVVRYVDNRESAVGVSAGLPPLDLALGSLLPSDLILLAARPSMGKSAIALALGQNVGNPQVADLMNGREYDGRPPQGVIQFHGEMTWGKPGEEGGQVGRRMVADVGYAMFGSEFPTYEDIRNKKVSVAQRVMLAEAADVVGDPPIVGIKRTGMRLSNLKGLIRRQQAIWRRAGINLGLVVVDHVGLLRAEGRTSGRYEAQTEIAIEAKELADELNCAILALVQLSRNVEQRDDKRPQLADLRDSGAWEENADVVLFAYREAYYAERQAEPDINKENGLAWNRWDAAKRSRDIEVILGKKREGRGGQTAKVWGALEWNAIRGAEPDRLIRGLI